jgi:hypothetical protein
MWGPNEKRECVFVIIGKHLEQKWLEDKFRSAAVTDSPVETIEVAPVSAVQQLLS